MAVRPIRRVVAGIAAATLSASVLAACGGGSGGKASLNWYINPDGQDTLNKLAKDCSTDKYNIKIQLLPASATDQRTQLARSGARGFIHVRADGATIKRGDDEHDVPVDRVAATVLA